MSAIDEMYEKYGIKQKITCTHAECPQFSRVKRDKCPATNNEPNEECLKYAKFTTAKRVYPDFTAEKQLALIKWIVKDNIIGFFKITQGLSKDYILFYEGCKSQHEDFTQALAKLTTELYYSLPEAQRQEVKEILER